MKDDATTGTSAPARGKGKTAGAAVSKADGRAPKSPAPGKEPGAKAPPARSTRGVATAPKASPRSASKSARPSLAPLVVQPAPEPAAVPDSKPLIKADEPAPTQPAPQPDTAPNGAASPSTAVAVAVASPPTPRVEEQTWTADARVQQPNEILQAMTESTAAAARGLVEINSKLFALAHAQADAAFNLWRSTLTAGSLVEAIQAQASGVRKAYEATAMRWKDLYETTNQVVGATLKPVQSVWSRSLKR